jgi:uncharacterized protein (DUF4415 family)
MTAKSRKTKRKKKAPRAARIGRLQAAVEDDFLSLAEEKTGVEARWSRPRKKRISLRVDIEVVEWLQSRGPGYQTRINRILRRVMMEGKRREGKR